MRVLTISLAKQQLTLHNSSTNTALAQYPINTAKNGYGEIENSECTPRGKHIIADKIGGKEAINTIFVGRQPIKEIYQTGMIHSQPKDYILTRILRLRGTEEGFNKGHNALGQSVDSFARYIYIHGSPDDADFTTPNSKGCIRMRNKDIIELYQQVKINDQVIISEN